MMLGDPDASDMLEDISDEGWFCGAFHPEKDWRCTLPAGHDGEHSACIQSVEWARKGRSAT